MLNAPVPPNPDDLLRSARETCDALEAGLAIVDANGLVHHLVEVLERTVLESGGREPDVVWIRKIFLTLYASKALLQAVKLLHGKEQVRFWVLLDFLFSLSVLPNPSEDERLAAEAFVAGFPIPAVRTAARLLVRYAGPHGLDEARSANAVLDLLEGNATSPNVLRAVAQLRWDHQILCAGAMDDEDSSEAKMAQAFGAMDEQLSHDFGEEFSVRSVGFFRLSEKQLWRTRRQKLVAILDDICAPPLLDTLTPFVQGFRQYLLGRLFAHTAKPKPALACFEKAIELGFSIQKVIPQHVAVLLHLGKFTEATTLMEHILNALHLQPEDLPGTALEPLISMYEKATGVSRSPGVSEPDLPFQDSSQRNRLKLVSIGEEMETCRRQALDAIWTQGSASTLKMLSQALHADDYDCALKSDGSTTEEVQLSLDKTLAAHLDELPAFSEQDREILVRAAIHGVPGNKLANVRLDAFFDLSVSDQESLLSEYKHTLGRSVELGKRLVAMRAEHNLQAAVDIVEFYKDKRFLKSTLQAELVCALMEEYAGRLSQEQAVAVGLGYVDSLKAKNAKNMVRSAIREILVSLLKNQQDHEERKRLIGAIRDVAGDLDGTVDMLKGWLTSVHLKLVTSAHGEEARELEKISRELSSELGDAAQERTRDALLNSLRSMPVGESPIVILERLAWLCPGDETAEKAIAGWFETGFGRLTDPTKQLEAASTGEWLAGQLKTPNREGILCVSTEHLKQRLATTRVAADRFLLLARLDKLVPENIDYREELNAIAAARSMIITGVGAGAMIVLGVLSWFYAF